ncbi:MAG TPA: hypothetical protein VF590_25330 [Isosphaeraceae bacterium]
MVHLRVERPLGQGLLQLVEKAVRIEGRLRIGAGQQLVEQDVGDLRLFASRHVGAPLLPSCPLTHEIPDRAKGRQTVVAAALRQAFLHFVENVEAVIAEEQQLYWSRRGGDAPAGAGVANAGPAGATDDRPGAGRTEGGQP